MLDLYAIIPCHPEVSLDRSALVVPRSTYPSSLFRDVLGRMVRPRPLLRGRPYTDSPAVHRSCGNQHRGCPVKELLAFRARYPCAHAASSIS